MKFLTTFIWILFLSACGSTTEVSKLFDIQVEGRKKAFKQNESVRVAIQNKKDIKIDNIVYSVDGKVLPLTDGKITFDLETLGSKTLTAKIEYEGVSGELSKKIKLLAGKAPEVYTYEVLNTYPHDTKAYTQGLEFKGDTLYESTGKKGASVLRKVDFKTGDILEQIELDDTVFGEGLTLFGDKIVQLTWQSGIGYVYRQSDLSKIETFSYGKSKEGWGLCNDGEKIFKSDGTEKIWLLDPETLTEMGYIETVTNKSIFNKANELEYLDGKIYANVYGKESMMIIDATSGAIEGVINFGGLKKQVKKGPEWDEGNSVLNGVAYHQGRKTFFVTGKNWDKLFEVKISKK